MRASVSACGRFLRCSAASSANRSSTSSLFSPELAKRSSLSLQTKRPRPLANANLKGVGSCCASAGKSLFTNCSCSATVAVEITTRVPRASAMAMAGAAYANDLPTPVPACTTAMAFWGSGAPSSTLPSWASDSVCAICAAILRCPSRRRKPGMEATTASKDSRASVAHFFWLIVGWFGLRSGKRCVKNSFQYIFTAKTAYFYLCCGASLERKC